MGAPSQGLSAHPWPRNSKWALKSLRPPGRRSGTPPPPAENSRLPLSGPTVRAHHDYGRPGAGPPGPLPAFFWPPAGAGGPNCGSSVLTRPRQPLSLPLWLLQQLRAAPTALPAWVPDRTEPVVRAPQSLYRPPQATPPRRSSTVDVSAHIPRRSTRSPIFSQTADRNEGSLEESRAARGCAWGSGQERPGMENARHRKVEKKGARKRRGR